jgi:hypothetical protein
MRQTQGQTGVSRLLTVPSIRLSVSPREAPVKISTLEALSKVAVLVTCNIEQRHLSHLRPNALATHQTIIENRLQNIYKSMNYV